MKNEEKDKMVTKLARYYGLNIETDLAPGVLIECSRNMYRFGNGCNNLAEMVRSIAMAELRLEQIKLLLKCQSTVDMLKDEELVRQYELVLKKEKEAKNGL